MAECKKCKGAGVVHCGDTLCGNNAEKLALVRTGGRHYHVCQPCKGNGRIDAEEQKSLHLRTNPFH